MKLTIRTVIAIRVIVAVWSVMSVRPRTIARIMRPPGVIAVVVRVVPGAVVDIGVVVIDDGGTAAPTPTGAPVHIPGVPAPAEASTPAATTNGGANRDPSSKVQAKGSNWQRRSHVHRHHHRRTVNHRRVVLRNIDNLRVRRLNHDRSGRWLCNYDLRIGLQRPCR